MNTLINILVFQGVACLLLGVVFFTRRFFRQPIDRIRLTQFGFALVAAAMLWLVFGPKYPVSISHGNRFDTVSTENVTKIKTVSNIVEEPPIRVEKPDFESQRQIVPVAVQYPFMEPILPQALEEENLLSPPITIVEKRTETATVVIPTHTETTDSEKRGISKEFLIFIVFVIFLAPPLLLLIRDLIAWCRLAQMLRRSNFAPELVVQLFEQIRGNSRRHVDVRISEEIATPVVFGIFRTILLLPSRITSPEELRACLVHEWSHLKNGDLATWNIVRLFQYPLWMQPFYWLLRSRLLVDQDYLADDEAAHKCSAVADYAQVLFNLAQHRSGVTSVNALGMAGQKSQLRRRIEMLLNPNRPSRTSNKRSLFLPLIFMTLLAVLGTSVRFGETTVAQDKPEEKTVAKSEMQPLSIIRIDNKEFEVSGILYDKDGKPANGAAILLYESENSGPTEIVNETQPVRTGEDGKFELKRKKMFAILGRSADSCDFFFHKIPQKPEEAEPQIAQLVPGETITGKVVDKDGNAITGATVGYYTKNRLNYQVESDTKGQFTIHYPKGGPEVIALFALKSKAGLDYRLFGSEFDEDERKESKPEVDLSQPFTLTLSGAETLRLKMQWDDGTPAAGITVAPWTLRNPDQTQVSRFPIFSDQPFNFALLQYSSRKITDANGVVEFDWIPDWAEEVGFFYADFPWWAENVPWLRLSVDFKRDSYKKTVVLHRKRKASGMVRFPDGRPAEGITVKCDGSGLQYNTKRFSAKTDANGYYEFNIDPEAAYVLAVENNDWGATPYNPLVVNAKTKSEELQNLDFTLRKTVLVRGNVVFGPKKEHLKGLNIGFSVSGKTDLDLPKDKQLTPIEGEQRYRGDEEGCSGPDLRYGLWFGSAAIDENGNFSKRLGPGEYRIGISENFIGMKSLVRRLLPEDAKIIVPENAGEEIVLNLEAKASGNGRLQGHVLLADGTPAVGATLIGAFHKEGYSNSLTPDFSAETDAEGKFDAPRTLEAVWLFAKSKDGSQQAVLSLDEKTESLGEPIRLQPLGSAIGRVVDFHGQPISNLEIRFGIPVFGFPDTNDRFFDEQRNFSQRIRSQLRFGGTTETNAEGKFRIDGIIANSDCYVVYPAAKKVQLGGNDGFELAKIRCEKGGETRDLGECRVNPVSIEGWKPPSDVKLPKFTAKFLDDKTGQPITNLRVDIAWARIRQEKEAEKRTPGVLYTQRENTPFTGENLTTDAEGKVEFSFPKDAMVYNPNEVELQVSCFRSLPGGSGPKDWNRIPYVMLYEVTPGPFTENKDFTFRLIPYPVVSGKILDPDGKPISGATLKITTLRQPTPEEIEEMKQAIKSQMGPETAESTIKYLEQGVRAGNIGYVHKEADAATDADGTFQAMVAPGFNQGNIECNAPGFVPCRIDLKDRKIDKELA